MMKDSEINCNDKDFLWVFGRLQILAILLSDNGKVIAVTPAAKKIFNAKKNVKINSLFEHFGLEIEIKKNAKKPIIKISNEVVFNSLTYAKRILNLDWRIREKSLCKCGSKHIILYSELLGQKCLDRDCEFISKLQQESGVRCFVGDYATDLAKYLENIILCMPGNVFWLDKNGVHLGCNDGVARLLGLSSREDIVGKTYDDLLKELPDIVSYIDSWKRDSFDVIRTGKPKLNIEEKPIVGSDGLEWNYLTSRVPLFDDKGNVSGVLGVSIDISDRKKAQKMQIEKDKEIAEKTEEFMQVLAGSIAHEIRTPLAIIGVNVDLIAMDSCFVNCKDSSVSNVSKYFDNIRYAVKSTAYIIDNILTTLRTISSKEMEENKFVKLSIANDIETLLEVYPFLKQEKLLVSVLNGDVKNFTYFGDKLLTQHVLFNLLKNALQAIKEAGKGEIEISFIQDKKYNVLVFRDTALGVSEEDMCKVFDQFKTVKSGGAGLGMAFCKMVMQSYSGDIVCESKRNEYTEFKLSFPKILDE